MRFEPQVPAEHGIAAEGGLHRTVCQQPVQAPRQASARQASGRLPQAAQLVPARCLKPVADVELVAGGVEVPDDFIREATIRSLPGRPRGGRKVPGPKNLPEPFYCAPRRLGGLEGGCSAKLGPGTVANGSGAKNGAEWIGNQNRRPILRPFCAGPRSFSHSKCVV